MPTLFLVGTPIGNLEDITLRALRVLKEVGLVAAEDTRRARILFNRYGIKTPLVSYHEQGPRSRVSVLLRHLAEKDVALISEAGMPTVSDPGYGLVKAALERGTRIEVVPGPSAVTAALALSGLPSHQFLFLGFLPRAPGERRRLLASLLHEPRTAVAFEAPHRLAAALAEIAAILGERPLAICRELTKRYEEVFRGTAQEAALHFRQPKGEFTLVIAAGQGSEQKMAEPELQARAKKLREEGATARDAVSRLAEESGRPRRELYRLWLKMGRRP